MYNAGSSSGCPVAFGVIGSVGGIDLLSRRCVHAATVHFVVDREKGRLPRLAEDHCLINLFARQQGIMFRRRSHGPIASAADVIEKKLSLAVRETSCGTYHLTSMLFEEKGVKLEDYPYKTAPCLTHGEAAGAVASGIADAAVGIRRAADELGLDFAPLLEEDFYLMLPSKFMGEPRVLTLVDAVLDKIRKAPERLRSGYLLEKAGNMVPLPANR